MGMYLMRQIGTPRRLCPSGACPDFMVFLNWTELPCLLVRLQLVPLRRC